MKSINLGHASLMSMAITGVWTRQSMRDTDKNGNRSMVNCLEQPQNQAKPQTNTGKFDTTSMEKEVFLWYLI